MARTLLICTLGGIANLVTKAASVWVAVTIEVRA